MFRVTFRPAGVVNSAMNAVVRCSSNAVSGWACKCRRHRDDVEASAAAVWSVSDIIRSTAARPFPQTDRFVRRREPNRSTAAEARRTCLRCDPQPAFGIQRADTRRFSTASSVVTMRRQYLLSRRKSDHRTIRVAVGGTRQPLGQLGQVVGGQRPAEATRLPPAKTLHLAGEFVGEVVGRRQMPTRSTPPPAGQRLGRGRGTPAAAVGPPPRRRTAVVGGVEVRVFEIGIGDSFQAEPRQHGRADRQGASSSSRKCGLWRG